MLESEDLSTSPSHQSQGELFQLKPSCISLISDLGRKQWMDSLPSHVGGIWCISWTLWIKSLLWGSNRHNNRHIDLHHYPWSWDFWSKLHFCIINPKQVHPELGKPHFGLTQDHELRGSVTKDWSDISTMSIYYTTDGLKYGCQQQPICEPEPHHCRFLHHLTFWLVQFNISSWYIMLNEFQS